MELCGPIPGPALRVHLDEVLGGGPGHSWLLLLPRVCLGLVLGSRVLPAAPSVLLGELVLLVLVVPEAVALQEAGA